MSRTDLPRRIFSMLVQEILTLLPDLTVILQLADELPEVAVIFAVPELLAVTTPSEFTEATEESELDHLTEPPLALIASWLPVYMVSEVVERLMLPEDEPPPDDELPPEELFFSMVM